MQKRPTNKYDTIALGEWYRSKFFNQDYGYGCYQAFELKEKVTNFSCNEENIYFCQLEDVKCRWHWEGDGTLCFQFDDFAIINDDCKKDYEWKVIEINEIDNYFPPWKC